jgi:pimeloyl-ACP methyl ester carboxylesterase
MGAMVLARKTSFPSGDRTLRGNVFGEEGARVGDAALLFVHGLGSSQEGYANRATAASESLRIPCLTFDLSGHGLDRANAARYSVVDHLEDVVAAYDHLAAIPNGPVRIGASGASYGAYLAALLINHRPVQSLLLRAPALAKDVTFPSDAGEARSPRGPDAFDSLGALSRFDGPVLILESELDERIPHAQILAYLDACGRAEHEVIAGATHALTEPEWDAAFVDAIIRWFRDL